MLKVHKKEFQEWMGMISFTHNITIEPSASHPLSFDELCQRLRKVLFDINRKHLKKRHWEKWKPDDKFWIMGFQEGAVKGDKHQLHYHLLLHSPANHKVNIWDDLHWGWMKNASVNPVNGKKRKMVSYRKDDFHFGNETLVEHMPLQVEPIRDITASTIYASKKMHNFDYDNHFVIGVKE